MAIAPLIEFKAVTKTYVMGENRLQVLKGINFKIQQGSLTAIIGASGSGKSTIMNIVGLLDRPSTGDYLLAGKTVATLEDDDMASIRNQRIGFVFQSFFLLPRLNALQNVGLPLIYRGMMQEEIEARSHQMLQKVDMGRHVRHKPHELSGGQQQRVAIARALIGNPSLILGDEPTGALDTKTGQEVMNLFIELNRDEKVTILLITHDPKIAQQCSNVIQIQDGNIIE